MQCCKIAHAQIATTNVVRNAEDETEVGRFHAAINVTGDKLAGGSGGKCAFDRDSLLQKQNLRNKPTSNLSVLGRERISFGHIDVLCGVVENGYSSKTNCGNPRIFSNNI